jgi:hypothetical protein
LKESSGSKKMPLKRKSLKIVLLQKESETRGRTDVAVATAKGCESREF